MSATHLQKEIEAKKSRQIVVRSFLARNLPAFNQRIEGGFFTSAAELGVTLVNSCNELVKLAGEIQQMSFDLEKIEDQQELPLSGTTGPKRSNYQENPAGNVKTFPAGVLYAVEPCKHGFYLRLHGRIIGYAFASTPLAELWGKIPSGFRDRRQLAAVLRDVRPEWAAELLETAERLQSMPSPGQAPCFIV